jgi:hypothetical protein
MNNTYTAFLTLYDDEKRANFVLENFVKHNPDIPLMVYNGGSPKPYMKEKYNLVDYQEGPNWWQLYYNQEVGCFTIDWFERMFEIGLNMNSKYLIHLETDVYTARKIEKEPEYDLSGPVIGCGDLEQIQAYKFWSEYAPWQEGKPKLELEGPKIHTCMGGTAFSKNFFEKAKPNFHFINKVFELTPWSSFCDVQMTLLGRYSGCTWGDWSEVSDTRGTARRRDNGWIFDPDYSKAAMTHNYKI